VNETEDVFHLRLDELEAIGDLDAIGDAAQARLQEAVLRRSAKRQELVGVQLLDPASVFPQRDRGDALVSGTPASAGTATGTVRVIREPAESGGWKPTMCWSARIRIRRGRRCSSGAPRLWWTPGAPRHTPRSSRASTAFQRSLAQRGVLPSSPTAR
jgi:hypothetical protein